MPGFGPTPENFAERYARDMAAAAAMYADAVSLATALTGDAFMTQLGGMCLAIECRLEGGWLWITDEHDNLPWNREQDHTGWSVGIYAGDHRTSDPEYPVVFLSTGEATLAALTSLLSQALGHFTRASAPAASDRLTDR